MEGECRMRTEGTGVKGMRGMEEMKDGNGREGRGKEDGRRRVETEGKGRKMGGEIGRGLEDGNIPQTHRVLT